MGNKPASPASRISKVIELSMSRMKKALSNKTLWIFLVILAVGAYLRLGHIQTLFNVMGDYDQGVYSLDARLITQGYLPYSGFVLVHPPLYILALAAVYKVFGYSLFVGKYFSVALSLASIIFIYLIGKKLSKPVCGLVAAALFAVSPDMVYYGQRVVQEPLGIFLVILGIYFSVLTLTNKGKKWALASGLSLGLAVATKYTFLPALFAVIGVMLIFSLGDRFGDTVRKLARPASLLIYASIVAALIAVLMIIQSSFAQSLPVPFINDSGFSALNLLVTIVVFILPIFATLIIIGEEIHLKRWFSHLFGAVKQREVWGLVLGALLSFVLVNIFFWLKAFPEFVNQTLMLQNDRSTIFPSFIGLIYSIASASGFGKIDFLPMILALPLALILLNKRSASKIAVSLSFGIIIAFIACQFLPAASRYYISIFPFSLIALSLLVPLDQGLLSIDLKTISPNILSGLAALMAIFVIFISTSVVLISNGSYCEFDNPFDNASSLYTPDAREAYTETIDYLKSISAQKVYSVDPMISALASSIKSSTDFDAFSSIRLGKESPDNFIQNQISQGVDYIVVSNIWNMGHSDIGQELLNAISARYHLIKIINPDSFDFFTIYAVN